MNQHATVVKDFGTGRLETVHPQPLLMYRADMEGKTVSSELIKAAEHLDSSYQVVASILGISKNGNDLHLQLEWEGLPDEIDWTWEPIDQAYEDVPTLLLEFLPTPMQTKLKHEAKRRLRVSNENVFQ